MMTSQRKRFEGIIDRIGAYFEMCDEFNTGKKDIVKPYTMSGLLCFCGLSRKEFEELGKNKRYTRAINEAKAKIEAFIEENMLTGALSCNASLNSLKYNFDWGDKGAGDNSDGAGKSITVTLSPEMCELAK
jgi:hypothetical protein